jgi:hypothetical protein
MYEPYPAGDTELPETRRPPAPASVLNAVKVMYAGAATSSTVFYQERSQ